MKELRATPKERKPTKDRITFSSVLFHATSDFIQEKTTREKAWTEALAVGCYQFVEAVKKRLGVKATYRSIKENSSGTACLLQEPIAAYNPHFGHEMADLSSENSLPWHCFLDM